MDIVKHKFSLKNSINKLINGDVYYPNNSYGLPLIIILHGFKGWKDWGFAPYISETFAINECISLIFNFSMNGSPDDTGYLTEPENFANNTISRELEDVLQIIDAFPKGDIIPIDLVEKLWNGNIYLLGFSLGGGISILTGLTCNKINKVCLWSSISSFNWYTPRQIEQWKKDGFFEFKNTRTNQVLRMNIGYLNDYYQNEETFNILERIKHLKSELMIVHSDDDITVPIKEANKLIEAANKELLKNNILKKTSHTFGVEHPFKRTTKQLEEALDYTLKFFDLK